MIKEIYTKELSSDITDLTNKIYLEFPELYDNLDETPQTHSGNNNDIGLLFQYLESLKVLYQSFKNHQLFLNSYPKSERPS